MVYLTKLLGKGSYAEVYEGLDKDTKESVAVRIVSKLKLSAHITEYIYNEGEIWIKLIHPNVLKLYSFTHSKDNFYFVTEKCDYDLDKYLKRKGKG